MNMNINYNSSNQTKATVGVMRGQQTELLYATSIAKTNTKTNVRKNAVSLSRKMRSKR